MLVVAVLLSFISSTHGYGCLDYGGDHDAFVCTSSSDTCSVYVHTAYDMSCDAFCESHDQTCVGVDDVLDGSNMCDMTYSDIGCRATRQYQRCKCSKLNNCNGYKATGGCSATGSREPNNDFGCGNSVVIGKSGYCDCDRGKTIGFGCQHKSPLYCLQECTQGDTGWQFRHIGNGYCRYGKDYRDYIGNVGTKSLSECQIECFDHGECSAISWKSSECNMYRTGPHGGPYTYTTGGCSDCICLDFNYRNAWTETTIGDGFCRSITGTWDLLADIGSVSKNECRGTCVNEPNCVAISWGTNECNLYGSTVGPYLKTTTGSSCHDCVCSLMEFDGDGVVEILSVDHSSGTTGKYFNYKKEEADGAIGKDWWDNEVFTVQHWRNGAKIREAPVRLWRATNGGSVGSAHGRLDSGAANGQFQTNDFLLFKIGEECDFDVQVEGGVTSGGIAAPTIQSVELCEIQCCGNSACLAIQYEPGTSKCWLLSVRYQDVFNVAQTNTWVKNKVNIEKRAEAVPDLNAKVVAVAGGAVLSVVVAAAFVFLRRKRKYPNIETIVSHQ